MPTFPQISFFKILYCKENNKNKIQPITVLQSMLQLLLFLKKIDFFWVS
jgi:hypothetical protein